jgi:beta-glucanase (GH16 family)
MKYNKNIVLLTILTLFFACGKDSSKPVEAKPTLSIADISQPEGNATGAIIFKVTLSKAATTNVLVNFATLAGTAAAGTDFTAKTDGELVFAAGETEKNISISTFGDDVKESDESFQVLLLNPVNATLAHDRATATLQNDDLDNPLNIPTTGYSTPETYAGKTLVWQDEFNDASLDANFWTHETGGNGWGNSELQYYRPENTLFSNGKLIIEARKESFGGSAYTSSRIVTKNKKSFKFGRIDIRAALPEGQGIWPALWMLGSNLDATPWPACGELDIMELVGHQPNRVYGTAHFKAPDGSHKQNGNSKALGGTAKFSQEFHVFSMIWAQDKVQWLLDDVVYHEITPATPTASLFPFNHEFFFIFNVAVGGQWPGNPDATTNFPQRMFVDYVRVFQ